MKYLKYNDLKSFRNLKKNEIMQSKIYQKQSKMTKICKMRKKSLENYRFNIHIMEFTKSGVTELRGENINK